MPPPRLTREMRDALAIYGHLLQTARQVEKAHALFVGMRELFPGDAYVTRNLAFTTLAAGDAAAALALADEARAAGTPDEAAAMDILRSKALLALGRLDEARASLGRALAWRRGNPGNAIAQGNGRAA
jgi:predicted Zn-dependent protease